MATGSLPTIRTPDQRLRVFISSTLNELAAERRAARDAIGALHLSPIFFEAGARPYPAQALYRSYVAQSDIFIGIYWQSYGVTVPGLAISGLEDEYRISSGKPRLIYVKQPAAAREPRLTQLLDHIRHEDEATYKKFSTADELRYQVAEDLAQLLTDQFASALEESSHATQLPRPRGPLVDRTSELADTRALLQRDDVNLVTLTGTGGVGKTRLAIEVARELAQTFRNGAAFIPLAPIRDPTLVVSTIAHALSVDGEDGRPLAETLLVFLRRRHLLLVVDNVEQVIEEVSSRLSEIVESAEDVKLLVTSREPLQIRGEWVVRVPPLEVPDLTRLPDTATLGRVPSVALFVRRASEVNPGFALTDSNAADVARVCERLDGLPLALELAAARVNVLAPKELVQRLEHRLPTLTRGPRDLPDRQQTLRNVFAWSYDLLEPREQELFRSLGVFSGSFGLDAVTAIDGAGALDRLESLVSKSLLRVEPSEDEPRFWMLATLHEYAGEQLDAHGERTRVEQRYLEFFVQLALAAEPHLLDQDREAWLVKLETEAPNLRAAYESCIYRPEMFEAGMRLVGALTYYWLQSGFIREGRAALDVVRARTAATDRSHARGKVLYGAGLLAWKDADPAAAARLAEEALSIFREYDDLVWWAHAEWVLAVSLLGLGHAEEAHELLDECLSLYRRAQHRWGEAQTLAFLGIYNEIRGDCEAALSYYRDTIAVLVQIHDVIYEAVARGVVAGTRCRRGDHAAVDGYFDELAHILEHATNRWAIGRTLQASAFNFQFNYHLYDSAKVLYQGSLVLWRDLQHLESGFSIVKGLIGIAEIAGIQHEVERAGWLFGAADRLAAPSGIYRNVFNDRATRARETLDPTAVAEFDAAWRDGHTATVEQSIEVALQPATRTALTGVS